VIFHQGICTLLRRELYRSVDNHYHVGPWFDYGSRTVVPRLDHGRTMVFGLPELSYSREFFDESGIGLRAGLEIRAIKYSVVLGCIEYMRCRLLLPMFAGCVCQSISLFVCQSV